MKTVISRNYFKVLLLLLTLSVSVDASEYYCDPIKGSSNNVGSQDSPWGKLEDVFKTSKTFEAGDIIYLLEGNHGDVSIIGANSKYVKIIGLDGAELNSLTFGNATTPSQKWSISNIIITNDDLGIYISANSSRIKITEVSIFGINSPIAMSKTELLSLKSVGLLVDGSNCKFENNNISGKEIAINNLGNKNKFKNNVISDFTKSGILTKGINNTIENNLIKESFQVNDISNIAIQIGNEGESLVVKNNIFRANYILNFKKYNRQFIGQLDGIVSKQSIENSIFENNVIVTNSVQGISLPLINNSKIYNNTLVNPYFGIVLNDKNNIENSIIVGSDKSPESVNVILRNNIANAYVLKNVTGVEDHNIKLNVDVKDYDKNFFSWAKFDFSLIESSSALNKGTFEGAPKTDANFVSRKLGNFINIGAYEYGKIDESNKELVIIVDPRDRELRSKGKDDWDGQPQIRVGGSGTDFDGVAVFPFQLPLLPGGKKIISADFSAYMIKIDNRPNGNLDVYGLPFKPKDKFWVVPHEMFYQGSYGQDMTARPIQSAIADGSSISGTTTLNDAGKIGLKGYLNTSYEAGANTGDFVFIRLNPSVKDVTPFNRWIFQSANTEKVKHKAKLYLTVGYPELNNEGVVFKELKNTVVASSNLISNGKFDLRFYGFEEGTNLKVKLYSYNGDIVFENDFTSVQVANVFIESVNNNFLPTGKYILEYEVKGTKKKQSVLLW